MRASAIFKRFIVMAPTARAPIAIAPKATAPTASAPTAVLPTFTLSIAFFVCVIMPLQKAHRWFKLFVVLTARRRIRFRGRSRAPQVLRRFASLPGYTTLLPRSNPCRMSRTTVSGWSICFACILGFISAKKCVATGPGQAAVTVTPVSSSSKARASLKKRTNAFEAA